jgi:hypothetical protein
MGKKVAKHSPLTPEVNKPQASISGVGISIALQYIQTPAIEVTFSALWLRFGLLPDSLKITWFWDLTTILQVCMEGAVDALAVPSDEHVHSLV